MDIKEFGIQNNKTLLIFHGACMNWQMYKKIISYLEKYFHILIPVIPGHNLSSNENFTSIEEITHNVEEYLLKNGYKNIYGIYGLSMGGALTLRFLSDNIIHADKVIIDGGITPYTFPKLITEVLALRDYIMIQIGRHNKKAIKKAIPADKYTQEVQSLIYEVIKHMSSKTIWRTFKSTNNYSLPQHFPFINTDIQYWYGEKEYKDRKPDIQFIKNYVHQITFIKIPYAEHGEYSMRDPINFTNQLIKFMFKNN